MCTYVYISSTEVHTTGGLKDSVVQYDPFSVSHVSSEYVTHIWVSRVEYACHVCMLMQIFEVLECTHEIS